mgnify:CR=1 FL=1
MEQSKIDESVWEMKDMRSARQSSIRSSSEVIAAMINVGAFKPEKPEDALKLTIDFADRFVDYIYSGMPKPSFQVKVDVEVTDGKKKTRENTEFLKSKGLFWDKDKRCWRGNFDREYWNKIKDELTKDFTVKTVN